MFPEHITANSCPSARLSIAGYSPFCVYSILFISHPD